MKKVIEKYHLFTSLEKRIAASGRYLIVYLKRYELNADPRPQAPDWPQTSEHSDIVTVLIHNYYLQMINTTSNCTLSFAEFGLLLAPKANQGRQGPTIIITLTRYQNLSVCLLLSYLVWILISVVGCSVNGSTIYLFGSSYNKACYTRLIHVIAHFLLLNLLYRRLMHVIAHCPLLDLVCGWPLKLTKVDEGLP